MPKMVTEAPKVAETGEIVVIVGGARTANETPLLGTPATVTTRSPVVAPGGTVATMPTLLQLTTVAGAPLNVTVLAPCVVPKPVPAMFTTVPTAPIGGRMLVIVRAGGASVAVVEAHSAPAQAVIVVEPTLATNALPWLVTSLVMDAVVGFDELHVTDASCALLPFP